MSASGPSGPLVQSCGMISSVNQYSVFTQLQTLSVVCLASADPEGGTRDPDPPLKNYKNIGFLSNTGPDPLKITKLSSQHSMISHYRHASNRFAGGR